jgi:hypothetical protein
MEPAKSIHGALGGQTPVGNCCIRLAAGGPARGEFVVFYGNI